MNFLAIPTLKNDRACLRRPSSIRPLRSSNVTLESERTGIAGVGSFRRCAASMTRSATPTSFFSTVLTFRAFAAIGVSYPFPRRERAFDLAVGWALLGLRSIVRPCAARPALSRRPVAGGAPLLHPAGVVMAVAFLLARDFWGASSSTAGGPFSVAARAPGGF